MKELKTPKYTRKAIKDYEQKVIKKTVVINQVKDSKLIEKIENDKTAFSELVKILLRKHYKIEDL